MHRLITFQHNLSQKLTLREIVGLPCAKAHGKDPKTLSKGFAVCYTRQTPHDIERPAKYLFAMSHFKGTRQRVCCVWNRHSANIFGKHKKIKKIHQPPPSLFARISGPIGYIGGRPSLGYRSSMATSGSMAWKELMRMVLAARKRPVTRTIRLSAGLNLT